MSTKPGAFRIEPYASDGHMYWEIDIEGMTATRWVESSDDDWSGESYPLMRTDDGWRYYEDEGRWRRRIDALGDQLRRIHINVPASSVPDTVRELYTDTVAEVSSELSAATNQGPSWRDLPKDVSAEIEKRWIQVRGESK
jgi:hypothetical protein